MKPDFLRHLQWWAHAGPCISGGIECAANLRYRTRHFLDIAYAIVAVRGRPAVAMPLAFKQLLEYWRNHNDSIFKNGFDSAGP